MSKKDDLIDDFTNLDYGFSRLKIDRNRSDGIFLNIFDAGGIRYLMKKCGLHDHLKKKRFYPYTIIVFRDENDIHNLRILESERNVPLVDLRVSEKRFVKTGFDGQTLSFDMVAIEWLSTRDPRLFTFKSNRPQLPGQTHPSLGCLSLMMKMMYLCSRRIHKDAFMDVPDHLHLALMYSSFFHFLDPAAEAVIRAVKRGLKGYSLSEIAWGAVTGSIFDKKTGELFVYKPSEQLYPVSRRMKRYFSSKPYQDAVKNSNPGQFTLNRDNLDKKIESAKKKYL